jgi:hypothetical protein
MSTRRFAGLVRPAVIVLVPRRIVTSASSPTRWPPPPNCDGIACIVRPTNTPGSAFGVLSKRNIAVNGGLHGS